MRRKWGRDGTEIETETNETFCIHYNILCRIEIVTLYEVLPVCPAFYVIHMKILKIGPGQCASVGWMSSLKAKCRRFNFQSGHVPGLRVRSPVGACTEGNQSMFLSHPDVSLPFSLPPPLSKINK